MTPVAGNIQLPDLDSMRRMFILTGGFPELILGFVRDINADERSDLVGETAEQTRQPGPADRQHAVHRRQHDDLPIASVALPADFTDPPQVHAPGVVDPVKAAPTEDRGDLAQRPDVEDGAAAALPNDGVVTVRLQQVHVIGLDDGPAQR